MATKLTAEVADELGVPPYVLENLVQNRRIARPAKDRSGRRVWTPADVQAAREALAARKARAK